MCICIYVHQRWQPDHYKTTYRSFQSIMCVNTQICTNCLCTLCPWVHIVMCTCESLYGLLCLHECVHMSRWVGVCVRMCVCRSYQDTSASWLVESVLISPVFKPLLSDQSCGKAPGPLVHTHTFLSVFHSSPQIFLLCLFPLYQGVFI